jgi:hypothetical protein
MKLAQIRRHALSMPEVSEQPHFEMSSLRVRGKIFVTFPAGGKHLHVFVAEPAREMVIAMYPEFLEKLTWGGKVVGLRVHLPRATPAVVKHLVSQAWANKAPKSLLRQAAPARRRAS